MAQSVTSVQDFILPKAAHNSSRKNGLYREDSDFPAQSYSGSYGISDTADSNNRLEEVKNRHSDNKRPFDRLLERRMDESKTAETSEKAVENTDSGVKTEQNPENQQQSTGGKPGENVEEKPTSTSENQQAAENSDGGANKNNSDAQAVVKQAVTQVTQGGQSENSEKISENVVSGQAGGAAEKVKIDTSAEVVAQNGAEGVKNADLGGSVAEKASPTGGEVSTLKTAENLEKFGKIEKSEHKIANKTQNQVSKKALVDETQSPETKLLRQVKTKAEVKLPQNQPTENKIANTHNTAANTANQTGNSQKIAGVPADQSASAGEVKISSEQANVQGQGNVAEGKVQAVSSEGELKVQAGGQEKEVPVKIEEIKSESVGENVKSRYAAVNKDAGSEQEGNQQSGEKSNATVRGDVEINRVVSESENKVKHFADRLDAAVNVQGGQQAGKAAGTAAAAKAFATPQQTPQSYAPGNHPAEQVGAYIRTNYRGPNQQMTITLSPPELGKVMMRFSEEGGQVTARLEVERAQTQTDIQQSLPQVVRALQEAGVNLRRVEVNLSNDNYRQESSSGFGDAESQEFAGESQQGGSGNRTGSEQGMGGEAGNPEAGDASYGGNDSLSIYA